MKKKKHNPLLVLFIVLLTGNVVMAQEVDSMPEKKIISLRYYNINNNIQYLVLQSQLKKAREVMPQVNRSYDIFLNSATPANKVATVKTGKDGKANAVIPPALKGSWDSASQHIFIVNEDGEEIISDYTITKSKISIDTSNADGVRSITAGVMRMENGAWVPAADVEMKLGIKRLGGVLSAGDEVTYTTDSSGTVTVELSKANLPGDTRGNYVLTALVEDDDVLGSVRGERVVPWGVAMKPDSSFFETRALWSTRTRAPLWLLFMAYGISIGVWGTLLYLVLQIVKIKKIGTSQT